MPDNAGNIVGWLFAALFVMIGAVSFARIVKNRFAPIRTVRAQVVDKLVTESFSKYSGTGTRKQYVVVFLAEGRKLSFCVSEFSYGGYRKKETGTLKYRGNRIIDFS